MLLSITAPLIAVPAVSAADSSDWYMTVNGNLDTDNYELYPYLTDKSLKIGFSKFGEMINSNDNVGLEYSAVDPFAPAAGPDIGSIVKSAWLNGWLLNITYHHTIRSELRTVWVSAQHGDPIGVTYGNDWIRVDFANDWSSTYGWEDPRDPGYFIGNYAAGAGNYGGRKTNATAVTQPMQVLYNGPRSFVALLKTTVYDHFVHESDNSAEDIPLLEVRFMILFNKVKKEVVVFKELKTLVADKYTDILKVQFSNRGEVDLGTENGGYASYFHFYTQGKSERPGSVVNDTVAEGLSTVYDRNWVLNVTESPSDLRWPGYSAAGPYPQTSAATYDLAVAVNPTAGYTWWAAFWPSLSDWSIDGWPNWWRSMSAWDPHDIDSRTWEAYPRNEPTIPFYIGEWDAELKPKGKTTPSGGFDQQMYRFVTVYGLTSRNDANDEDMATGSNVIDRETMYQLDEVFNPWDLESAVHKTTRSWVEWTSSTSYTTLRKPALVVSDALWDQYCVFSERVINLNSKALLHRFHWTNGVYSAGDYSITQNADGTARITGLASGNTYKILYSTLPDVTGVQSDTATWGPPLWYNVTSLSASAGTASETWTDQIDVIHTFSVTVPAFMIYKTNAAATSGAATNWTEAWSVQKTYNETDFKVFLGQTYQSTLSNLYDPINVTLGNVTFLFDLGTITKTVKAPTNMSVIWPNDKSETVHVNYLNHTIGFAFSLTQANYTDVEGVMLNSTWTITQTLTVTAYYRNYLMGRYEWTTVGRDAASVDSAGAALITAAFKNKQVEVGMAGSDMSDPEVANQMPWVMSKIGATDTWADYYYSGTDFRTGLRDDWCKLGSTSNDEWPVASSNMIGVGGPLANLLAYYGNDFTDVIFGLSDFTDYAAWENKLVPKTCWDHTKGYTDNNTIGYATISTYKDINGTVLFLVWGNWGRDTFYVSKWFHEHGVYQLQEAPAGITSIVVKINYESTAEGYKPTNASIVECLGTISERAWVHTYTKGGIHDP